MNSERLKESEFGNSSVRVLGSIHGLNNKKSIIDNEICDKKEKTDKIFSLFF
jgi:hypothetical protein